MVDQVGADLGQIAHHLDAMLALEHLDVLFVGPNDLAQSLGLPGQPNHPEVTKVADEVVARATAAGVKTGTVAYNLELVENVFSRGFDSPTAATLPMIDSPRAKPGTKTSGTNAFFSKSTQPR